MDQWGVEMSGRLVSTVRVLALVILVTLCWAGAARAQDTPQPEPTIVPLPTQQATATPALGGPWEATATVPAAPAADHSAEGDWFQRKFVGAVEFFLGQVTSPMQQLIASEWQNESGFILHTGPQITYNNETVMGYWGTLRTVANLALVVVAMWGGFNIIVRDTIGAEYHTAMQLLPRLVLGALMINTSPWFIKLLIDLNNALCSIVGQASPPGFDVADDARRTLMGLILWLVLLALLLVFQIVMLFRLAMLDFLIVLAPLASLFWVLPQTHGYARSWMRNFVGTVFSQFLQVLALSLSVSLLGSLKPMRSDQILSEMLLAIAMMLVVFKVPSLLAHQEAGGWVGSFLGYTVVRSVISRAGGSGRSARQHARTSGAQHVQANPALGWHRGGEPSGTGSAGGES